MRPVSVRKLLKIVAVCACVCAPIAWLLKAAEREHRHARKSQCCGNLKQIALALHNYQSVWGAFPPAYRLGPDGRPWHSWRVLILPFVEQSSLYAQYHLDEPWDGPNNRKLLGLMPYPYSCPNHRLDASGANRRDAGWTNYVAATGPGTAFPGAGATSFGSIADGLSDTLLVVETTEDIPWTEPRDLDVATMPLAINGGTGPGPSSRDPGDGAWGLFGDGMIRWLPNALPSDTLRAFLTIRGGEPADAEALLRRR